MPVNRYSLTIDVQLIPQHIEVLVGNCTTVLSLEELDGLEDETARCLVTNSSSFFLFYHALDCICRSGLAKLALAQEHLRLKLQAIRIREMKVLG